MFRFSYILYNRIVTSFFMWKDIIEYHSILWRHTILWRNLWLPQRYVYPLLKKYWLLDHLNY